MKKIFLMLCMAVSAAMLAISCDKNDSGAPVPTDKEAIVESEEDKLAKQQLCKPEHLGQTPMVVAYYTEYSSEIPDPNLVTHVNYAHGRFKNPKTGDGGIEIDTPSLMQKVLKLKETHPDLKVLLMIGGWGEHADGFSMMARDPEKRTLFCTECKKHIDNYGLDGVDIDWEYPGGGPSTNGKHKDDQKNFVLVLKELRETIGDTKIISYASYAGADYMDWKNAMLYLDYVNVMTYDMGKPPYHNSTLYKSPLTKSLSCDSAIKAHYDKGVDYKRMNLGIPFYGHGDGTIYKTDVKYNEMSAIFNAGSSSKYYGKNNRMWDDVGKVPYMVDENGTMLLGYDDEESVAYKGRYAKDKGLLGVMFWEYRHDDKNHTLLKSVVTSIYGKADIHTN